MKVANTDIRQNRHALHEANGGCFPPTTAKTAIHFTKQTEALPENRHNSQASTALKEILTTTPCKSFYRTTMKRTQSLGGMEGGLRMSAKAGPTGLSINTITLFVQLCRECQIHQGYKVNQWQSCLEELTGVRKFVIGKNPSQPPKQPKMNTKPSDFKKTSHCKRPKPPKRP